MDTVSKVGFRSHVEESQSTRLVCRFQLFLPKLDGLPITHVSPHS